MTEKQLVAAMKNAGVADAHILDAIKVADMFSYDSEKERVQFISNRAHGLHTGRCKPSHA